MFKREGLFRFLFFSFVFLILISIISISVLTNWSVKAFIISQVEKELDHTSRLIINAWPEDDFENYLNHNGSLNNFSRIQTFCRNMAKDTNIRITIILPDGMVAGDSHHDPAVMEKHNERTEIQKALLGEHYYQSRKSETLAIEMLYYAVPIMEKQSLVAVLRTAVSSEHITTLLREMYIQNIIIILFVLVCAGAVSYYLAYKLSSPLSAIAKTAKQYALFDFTITPIADGPGEIREVAIALKTMAEALITRFETVNRQKNELQTILSGMLEAVIVLDSHYVIHEINPAAIKLLSLEDHGIENREFKYDNAKNVLYYQEIFNIAKEALETKRNIAKTVSIVQNASEATITGSNYAKAARKLHLQVLASVINPSAIEVMTMNDGNDLTQVVLVLNDITQIKNLERIRKDFVANVSHELKTPITSIKGFVETMLDNDVMDRGTTIRFLNIIKNQSDRLNAIIEDLLSLSRLEHFEKAAIETNEYSLFDIVKSAIQMCEDRAEKKDITIRYNINGSARIIGNSMLIEQALVNLIDNAVKYSDVDSEIEISYQENSQQTIIIVRDNGPGIPEKHLPRIFERFYRVDKARSRQLGGTGLGLAIVKHIVLTHGGDVAVESTLKKGTMFTLYFPKNQKTND